MTSCPLKGLASAYFPNFISHSSFPPEVCLLPSVATLKGLAWLPFAPCLTKDLTFSPPPPEASLALGVLGLRTKASAQLSSLWGVQGLVPELKKLGPGVMG